MPRSSTAPDEQELDALNALLAGTPTGAEHLLPLLLQVQAQFGYISQPAIRLIAHAFNLSRAEVYGVVTFYHDLREDPVGKVVVQLCMAEACQAVGCRHLADHATAALGVPLGQSTPDGTVHLEAAYCFGNCALGPAVRIGNDVHGRVSPARFDALVQAARQESGQ